MDSVIAAIVLTISLAIGAAVWYARGMVDSGLASAQQDKVDATQLGASTALQLSLETELHNTRMEGIKNENAQEALATFSAGLARLRLR